MCLYNHRLEAFPRAFTMAVRSHRLEVFPRAFTMTVRRSSYVPLQSPFGGLPTCLYNAR